MRVVELLNSSLHPFLQTQARLSILGEFPNFLGICMYFYIHVNNQNCV